MVNTALAIGGTIGTIRIVFAVFVLLTPVLDIPNDGLIVSNGNHL